MSSLYYERRLKINRGRVFEITSIIGNMEEDILLKSEFLKNGKKHGLDENILTEVLDFLQSYQNVPAGERGTIRASLAKIIKKYAE